jgi:hypothetical protein
LVPCAGVCAEVVAVSFVASWRALLPAVLLAGVAAGQIVLTRVTPLSPWKAGGFGMFSTLDAAAYRSLRIFVEGPERSQEIELAPSLHDLADRTLILPTDGALSRLAWAVAAREARHARPVDTVRVQVDRVDFAPDTLAAHDHALRSFTLRVGRTPH